MKITVYPNRLLIIKVKNYSYPIKYLGYNDYEYLDD